MQKILGTIIEIDGKTYYREKGTRIGKLIPLITVIVNTPDLDIDELIILAKNKKEHKLIKVCKTEEEKINR